MRPEGATKQKYFDAPARAERLQLLLHLLRNAGEVIYLRAPAGAGKTRFAHRLLDILGSDIASVWIRGGIDTDVASAAIAQLGLSADEPLSWPDGVLAAVAEQDLLVVVDDADQLDLPAVERLTEMHARGGRVLLLGHGGLAQTTREWGVQYVDLPPFTVEQSTAFLRANAGDEAVHINDDLAGFLHHSAHGRPGLLLDSLDEVLVRARRQAETQRRRQGSLRKAWVWLGAVSVAVVLGAGLLFQDRINALIAPPEPDEEPVSLVDAPGPVEAEPNAVDLTANLPVPAPPQVAADWPEPVAGPELVPDIALPELSRLPSPAADAGAGGVTAGPAEADAETLDPLEAILRDALEAAADKETQGIAAATGSGAVPSAGDVSPGAALGGVPAQADSGDAASSAAVRDASPIVADAQILPPGEAPTHSADELPAAERPSVAEVAEELVEAAAPALQPEAKPAKDSPSATVDPPAKPAAPAPVATVQAKPETAVSDKQEAQSATLAKPDPGGPAPVEERTAGDAGVVTGTAVATRKPDTAAGPAPVEDRSGPVIAKARGPAPVVSTPRPTDVAPAGEVSGQSGPAPVVEPPRVSAIAAEVVPPEAGGGVAWLKSRGPGRYTLQLVGARERAAVEKFVRTHRVGQPYAIFERSLNGRPWYSLVAGDYPDRDAAIAARDRLPRSLGGSDIWPRTFGSVQENLK